MKAAILVLPLLLTACASPAAFTAAPPEDSSGDGSFSRSGAYLGAYGIQSYEQFDTHGSGVSTGNSDLGAGLRLGYRFTPNVALEAVAEDIKGFSVHSGSVDADLDLLQFGVMGKYFLATERFQPYLLVGGGAARSDINRKFNLDDDGGFLRGGLGMDVYLTSNFALFVEGNYNRMVGGVSDLHHIDAQAGILFRF